MPSTPDPSRASSSRSRRSQRMAPSSSTGSSTVAQVPRSVARSRLSTGRRRGAGGVARSPQREAPESEPELVGEHRDLAADLAVHLDAGLAPGRVGPWLHLPGNEKLDAGPGGADPLGVDA